MSSKCGSADLLEALGVNIMLTAKENEKILSLSGICFMMAQVYHSAMKYVAPVRKKSWACLSDKWAMDVSAQGLLGKRQGVSGTFSFNYKF